jgi:FAD synthase
VANIGVNPTFKKWSQRPGLEVHLLNYPLNAGEFYDQPLTVSFEKHLREERVFETPAALIRQIRLDCNHAQQYFTEYDHCQAPKTLLPF